LPSTPATATVERQVLGSGVTVVAEYSASLTLVTLSVTVLMKPSRAVAVGGIFEAIAAVVIRLRRVGERAAGIERQAAVLAK
jgi:hypothetical protein